MSTSHASVSNILHSFTWRLPAADAPPHPVHAAVVLLQDVLDNHVIRLEELGLNVQGDGHGNQRGGPHPLRARGPELRGAVVPV